MEILGLIIAISINYRLSLPIICANRVIMIIKDSKSWNKCFIFWISRETISRNCRVLVAAIMGSILVVELKVVLIPIVNNSYNIGAKWCLARWFRWISYGIFVWIVRMWRWTMKRCRWSLVYIWTRSMKI